MTPTKLLARVSEIRMKHDLIAELTGENFNVFGILGMQTAENRTHSAFLRELLDPKGTHGLGDAFLRAFIRMLRSKYSSSKAFSDCRGFNSVPLIEEHALVAKVVPELHVGCKSADLTQGGKIDLAVIPASDRWKILIENKIMAADQECQLVRYRNSDRAALLLYLTLDGKEASAHSVTNRVTNEKLAAGIDYLRLSYRDEILEWLETCAKEASARPLVRETIVQYAHLIRKLTHQNSSNLMTQEITKEILLSKESLLAYSAMFESRDAVRNEMLGEIGREIGAMASREGFEGPMTWISLEGRGDEDGQLISLVDTTLEKHNLGIGFGVSRNEWYYGFFRLSMNMPLPESNRLKELQRGFSNADLPECSEPPNEGWPAWRKWRSIQPWTNDLALMGEVYFGAKQAHDSGTDAPLAGFVKSVDSLATQMKQMAHAVFGASKDL